MDPSAPTPGPLQSSLSKLATEIKLSAGFPHA